MSRPFVVGDTVGLRFVEDSDIALLSDLSNDVESTGAFWTLSEVQPKVQLRTRFETNGLYSVDGGRLLVVDHDDRVVGMLVFFKPVAHWECLEIGYRVFSPTDHGKGYATEGVRLLAAFLFESRPIARLQIHCDPSNVSANRVAERAGFSREGTVRQAMFCRGRLVDLNVYGMTREESPAVASLLRRRGVADE